MLEEYQIRARYDKNSIVVYQAYSKEIASPALLHQRFAPPFSFRRMTWIKPSYRWLMYRSNWGQKKGQECILAIHITREGWDRALSLGVLTDPAPSVFRNPSEWRSQFEKAFVHIQWDTERSMRGAGLNHFSIQVGISRHLIEEYANQWIVKIEDLTPTTKKIRRMLKEGNAKKAQRLMPPERIYPVDPSVRKRLLIS